MTTTVSRTIGPTGYYANLQAWHDDAPASLVTADQIWEGKVQNTHLTSSTGTLLVGNTKTTDVNRYFKLTTDTGASFRDNGSASSNALRFNASNGAAISSTRKYNGDYIIQIAGYWTLSNLQFWQADDDSNAIGIAATSAYLTAENCIFEGVPGSNGKVLNLYGDSTLTNCLVVSRGGTSCGKPIASGENLNLYNCTIAVISSDSSGSWYNSGTATVKNTAFVLPAGYSSGGTATFTNCYTTSTGTTGLSGSMNAANQFQNLTSGTHDYRLKAGADLINAGTTGSGIPSTDIIGTTRSSPDVGCWEYAGAGGSSTSGRNLLLRVG